MARNLLNGGLTLFRRSLHDRPHARPRPHHRRGHVQRAHLRRLRSTAPGLRARELSHITPARSDSEAQSRPRLVYFERPPGAGGGPTGSNADLVALAQHQRRQEAVDVIEVGQAQEGLAPERLQPAAGVGRRVVQQRLAHAVGEARGVALGRACPGASRARRRPGPASAARPPGGRPGAARRPDRSGRRRPASPRSARGRPARRCGSRGSGRRCGACATRRRAGISPAAPRARRACRRGWRRRRRSARSRARRRRRRSRAPGPAPRLPRRRPGTTIETSGAGPAIHRALIAEKPARRKDRAISARDDARATWPSGSRRGGRAPAAGRAGRPAGQPARPLHPAADRPRRVALRRGQRPDAGERRLHQHHVPGYAPVQKAGRHLLAAGGQRRGAFRRRRRARSGPTAFPRCWARCWRRRPAPGARWRSSSPARRRRPARCWRPPRCSPPKSTLATTDAALCGTITLAHGGAGAALPGGARRTAGRPLDLAAVLARPGAARCC